MKNRFWMFLSAMTLSFGAFAANEGVPSYYQTNTGPNANQSGYRQYERQGYTKYIGKPGNKQVIDSRTYSYQVPRPVVPTITSAGTITTNGIAVPMEAEPATNIYVGYSRRFADFQFETGVNSILEWDDMIFNEITVGARHNFSLRDFDLSVFGEYTYGDLSHGGLSTDYDLEAFDSSDPAYGIFTVSMGDLSGSSNRIRFGIGARHIWDVAGWKFTPIIGYEIFKHDLEMSNHIYPNPGIYLPLMTNQGDYVFGDAEGNYYNVPTTTTDIPEDWYQVCMSPEDIKLVQSSGTNAGGYGSLGTTLITGDYTASLDTIPWGVGPGECVVIGGDGAVVVEGTTHIYNTTWTGFYVGLEIEKQMTLSDKLRLYLQFGLPKYSSEGTWPNRTDWQQNPSFIDEGDNGAYSYAAELEYNYKLSDRVQLALKVDTNVFHVGNIGGELYLASYGDYLYDENGVPILDDDGWPIWEEVEAHTEKITDSLKEATWQSFGLHLGIKYSF